MMWGERVRRFLGIDADDVASADARTDSVREAESEIERSRIVKDVLRSRIEPTGYRLGDAVANRRWASKEQE